MNAYEFVQQTKEAQTESLRLLCSGTVKELVKFMSSGITITATKYCGTLKRLWRTMQNKEEASSHNVLSFFVTIHVPIQKCKQRTTQEFRMGACQSTYKPTARNRV